MINQLSKESLGLGLIAITNHALDVVLMFMFCL